MGRSNRNSDLIRKPPPDEAQLDFFAEPLLDVALKDEREVMERPFLCVHRKPSRKPIQYQSQNGQVKVEAYPHQDFGLATINDWDIIIWAASLIWDEINETGDPPGRRIGFHPHALLRSIRRDPNGKNNYEKLASALDRLQSMTVKTTIRAGKNREQRTFSLLDDWGRVDDRSTGQPKHWSFTICKWLYEGITDESRILSLHPDYFLIKNETNKWLYRLARKHAGHQSDGFRIRLRELHRKNGTSRAYRKWKHSIKDKITDQVILDYSFDVYENREGDPIVHMIRVDQAEAFAQGVTDEEITEIHKERAQKAQELPPSERQAFWMAELNKHERRRENESRYADLHKTARTLIENEDEDGSTPPQDPSLFD